MKNAGRARRGVTRQGREKRRRRSEAGVEARDEESGPPGQPSRALSSESATTVGPGFGTDQGNDLGHSSGTSRDHRVANGASFWSGEPRRRPARFPGTYPSGYGKGRRSIDRTIPAHRTRPSGRGREAGVDRSASNRTRNGSPVRRHRLRRQNAPSGAGRQRGRCAVAGVLEPRFPREREREADTGDRSTFDDASEVIHRSSKEEPFARGGRTGASWRPPI
jgi:hypothetical protein